ncbi:hypothetical protein NDU88_004723 [Pleurodeles waltl]|uniref:Uncharacterized protein n=1 Tax=Pleurodeles waltl TaxID=8319 RepID=A0AAV7VHW4_PLEWA|nr:hypothetical protein NDU88_004723 [Pleurodeles waltl]
MSATFLGFPLPPGESLTAQLECWFWAMAGGLLALSVAGTGAELREEDGRHRCVACKRESRRGGWSLKNYFRITGEGLVEARSPAEAPAAGWAWAVPRQIEKSRSAATNQRRRRMLAWRGRHFRVGGSRAGKRVDLPDALYTGGVAEVGSSTGRPCLPST